MAKSFVSRLMKVSDDALEYIRKVLKERGTGYEIIDPASYEDEVEDEVYKLPRGVYVTKHGNYEEYPIVIINIDDTGRLTFEGLACIGEAYEDKIFTEEDLYAGHICSIADIVARLES